MRRQPDDEELRPPFLDQRPDRLEPLATGPGGDCRERVCDAEGRLSDRNADPLRPEVERKNGPRRSRGGDHCHCHASRVSDGVGQPGKIDAEELHRRVRLAAPGTTVGPRTDLSSIICTPIVDGDFIYGVCSYGQLRCIKAQTGERVWETMQATRGKLTPPRVAANEEPAPSERWSNAFIVKQGERYFLFNEQGDLIIARLSPQGYQEISRAHILEPTNMMVSPNRDGGAAVVWSHPAFAHRACFARNDKEIICVDLAAGP